MHGWQHAPTERKYGKKEHIARAVLRAQFLPDWWNGIGTPKIICNYPTGFVTWHCLWWPVANICRASAYAIHTWKQQSSTGDECVYFIRIKFSLISYKRTVQSQEDTSRNCDEFGANVTAEIPSSGMLFSFVSLILQLCPSKIILQKFTNNMQFLSNTVCGNKHISSMTEVTIYVIRITIYLQLNQAKCGT